MVKRLDFRGDTAFANPEIYEFLEAEGMGYGSGADQQHLADLLEGPVGRPPHELRRYFARFSYQAQSWRKPRRVVAKVEWHPGELYPRVGFIVNLARSAKRVLAFYDHAARRSNGSARARARSNGPDCHAVPSPQMPSVFNSMRSPTTLATSCGRWRCPGWRSRGR
jgi:hypothetical protein